MSFGGFSSSHSFGRSGSASDPSFGRSGSANSSIGEGWFGSAPPPSLFGMSGSASNPSFGMSGSAPPPPFESGSSPLFGRSGLAFSKGAFSSSPSFVSSTTTSVPTQAANKQTEPGNADPVPDEEFPPSDLKPRVHKSASKQTEPENADPVIDEEFAPSDLKPRVHKAASKQTEQENADPVPESALFSDLPPLHSVVEGFRVRQDQAEILKKIIARYGDITSSSVVTNLAVKSFLFGGVCDIVTEMMSQKNIRPLKDEDLHHWTDLLDEFAIQGLKVEWLQERIEELKKAKIVSDLSLMSKEYRDQLEELAKLKASEARASEELSRARADLEEAKRRVEEGEETLGAQQLKCQVAGQNLEKIKRAATILRSGDITRDLL